MEVKWVVKHILTLNIVIQVQLITLMGALSHKWEHWYHLSMCFVIRCNLCVVKVVYMLSVVCWYLPCHVTWSKQVCLLLFSVHSSGRPLPPSTASSSLLPPAPAPPPPAPLHSAPPTIRECQVPLLDSSSSHTMLEPHPEDQISPNSYLLRAQPPTGKPLPLISHWLMTPSSS